MAVPEVQLDSRQVTLISKALADPKRFEMLQRIGESKEAPTCSCLCDWVGIAPATVSHHIKELDNAGLVKVERDGKFAYVTFAPGRLARLPEKTGQPITKFEAPLESLPKLASSVR